MSAVSRHHLLAIHQLLRATTARCECADLAAAAAAAAAIGRRARQPFPPPPQPQPQPEPEHQMPRMRPGPADRNRTYRVTTNGRRAWLPQTPSPDRPKVAPPPPPPPCVTCGRPEQPERFHSHPSRARRHRLAALPSPTVANDETEPQPQPQPEKRTTVRKPVALRFRSKAKLRDGAICEPPQAAAPSADNLESSSRNERAALPPQPPPPPPAKLDAGDEVRASESEARPFGRRQPLKKGDVRPECAPRAAPEERRQQQQQQQQRQRRRQTRSCGSDGSPSERRLRGEEYRLDSWIPAPVSGGRVRKAACYLCSRQLGTAALPSHEAHCIRNYLREASGSNDSALNDETGNQQSPTVVAREDWTSAWEMTRASLVACEFCDRKFLPIRLEAHRKICFSKSCKEFTKNKVRQNVCCISNDEILYPVGGVITIHNFTRKNQRYIHLPNPDREISVVAVTKRKDYLAAAEKAVEGERPRIYIYDLENLKRIATLGIPFEIDTRQFSRIAFTCDGHHIAALTGGSDFFMYYFNWRSGKIESQAKANNPPSIPGLVTDMAINPKDATIIVFVGISLFRLLSMSENVWRQYGFQKAQSFSILSVCWLTDDRVLAGCDDGKVMIVQSGDLNGVHDMDQVTEINIVVTGESKKDQLKTLQKSLSKQMSSKQLDAKKHPVAIRCCTAIQTGFLYSQKPGEVVYFQKTSKTNYTKSRTFVIKKDVLCQKADYESLYLVNCICINNDGTLLLCSTNRSQIYWTSMLEHESDIVEFKVFEEPLHHGSIIGLSSCLWKPIFMTCGTFDNSVRIWNHATMKIVLNQTFTETINCISLHPTGLYALIGFADKIRFFLVLIHEFQVYREFGVKDCKILAFSNYGHLFAAECNDDILIYSSITFHRVSRFQGHCQRITSIQWSCNDLILHSGSSEGAIYEWSIEKNARISDVVLQDTAVTGLVALQKEQIICIDREGNLKEIRNSKIVGNKKLDHKYGECLDFITAIENSKCKLLLAGKNGVIISLNYPIMNDSNLEFFLMHNRKITQCCVVDGGRSFVSTDIDGTICIWNVIDEVVGVQPSTKNKYFEEILVNTDELTEKNFNLNHLSCRIVEVKSEHSFEIARQDNFHSNQIKQLEEKYTDEIKCLKKRIKTIEKEHSMELNRIHLDITQMKQIHTSQMDQMDSNFNSKLLYEFQNYDKLKEEMKTMMDTYEKKITKIQKSKNTENEKLELHYQREITDLQQRLLQLENTLVMEKKQNEFSHLSLQNQFAAEIASLNTGYKSKLQAEFNKQSDLKTELGITKKKLTMIHKEKEEFKRIKTASDNEYEIVKQKYNDAVYNIGRLKKEIYEKDECLEMEKEMHAETRRKVRETTSTQTEFEYKINALQKQLEEQKMKTIEKEEEIHKLRNKVQRDERIKARFKIEYQRLEAKLRSKDALLRRSNAQIHSLKIFDSNIRYDLCALKDLVQEPEKLKNRIKEISIKYVDK